MDSITVFVMIYGESSVMREPAFCMCKNKGEDQLRVS